MRKLTSRHDRLDREGADGEERSTLGGASFPPLSALNPPLSEGGVEGRGAPWGRDRAGAQPGGRARAARPRVLRWALATAVVAAAGALVGCSTFPTGPFPRPASDEGGFLGWHMQAPFDTTEIKTVYVYFKSQRFRRDLQLMLMESVTKEIELRTPYKVVGRPDQADAILSGSITMDDKNIIVEAPTNLPRQLSTSITVWITFKHNPPRESEKDILPTVIFETLPFVPEIGQTTLTGFYQNMENIAKQIVDMMEKPWFDQTDLQ